MKGMECSNCGAPARVAHGTYGLKEVGLKNVVLQGVEIVKCPKCKNEDPVIPNMNGLMRALALAVIEKPYRLTGEEVRFLRKYLRLTLRQGQGPEGRKKLAQGVSPGSEAPFLPLSPGGAEESVLKGRNPNDSAAPTGLHGCLGSFPQGSRPGLNSAARQGGLRKGPSG